MTNSTFSQVEYQDAYAPRPKHSHLGLWLAFGGVVGVILVSAFLAFAVFLGLNQVKDNGPIPARYSEALRTQNYALSYAYLAPNAKINGQTLGQAAFIEKAAQADARNGSITGYNLTENKNDQSQATLKIQRSKQSYDVHLRLIQLDNRWVISEADGL